MPQRAWYFEAGLAKKCGGWALSHLEDVLEVIAMPGFGKEVLWLGIEPPKESEGQK